MSYVRLVFHPGNPMKIMAIMVVIMKIKRIMVRTISSRDTGY